MSLLFRTRKPEKIQKNIIINLNEKKRRKKTNKTTPISFFPMFKPYIFVFRTCVCWLRIVCVWMKEEWQETGNGWPACCIHTAVMIYYKGMGNLLDGKPREPFQHGPLSHFDVFSMRRTISNACSIFYGINIGFGRIVWLLLALLWCSFGTRTVSGYKSGI